MPDDPGESSVIARLLRYRPGSVGVTVDAGLDDAAVLSDGLVLTVDALQQGVHFDHRLEPGDVGWKTVAVSVSDIAAMGATPRWALLSLSLPRPLDLPWVDAFARGLGEALTHWRVSLVGGDTTASAGGIAISLTMGGHASRPVLRSGAGPDELLWVTGTLGSAAAGFQRGGAGLAALRRPEPPAAFGAALGEQGLATAMMDLSDGLATDLPRLARASGVGAAIEAAALPLDSATADADDPLLEAMAWGEDYQLLFTSRVADRTLIETLAATHGVAVQVIGRTTMEPELRLDTRPWPEPSFEHFPGEAPCASP